MQEAPKLIVLRGPSGAGKSTVATLLHKRVTNKTALFDQDYYRHVMFNNLHSDIEAPRYVMFAGIAAALEHGYDVILEGFMGMGKYRVYLDALLASHPQENYFFYFDIDFDESLKRHATRTKSAALTLERMRELFDKSGPSGYPNEHIINQTMTAEEACNLVVATSKLRVN